MKKIIREVSISQEANKIQVEVMELKVLSKVGISQ